MPIEPVSPLRQRMIEDMTIRQFGAKTQRDYVRVVRGFTLFLGRSSDLGESDEAQVDLAQLALAEGVYFRPNPLSKTKRRGWPPARSDAMLLRRPSAPCPR